MSRKTRAQYFKRQGQQRQGIERSLRGKHVAMNAQMENFVTGQGGIQDRGTGQQPATFGLMNPFVYGMDQVRAAQWAWVMYAGDWAAQKVADIPVFDMYREGWDLKYTGQKPDGSAIEKAIRETEDKINLVTMFSRASRMERLFGGAVVTIGVSGKEGEDPSCPLTPDMVNKGDLRWLNVMGRNNITKVEWDFNPNSPGYGRPEHYNIQGQKFHQSRIIIFDNNPLTPYPGYDFMSAIGNWDGMGISIYGPLWDSLMRVNSYQQGAAHLAQSANVWIAARNGLKDLQAARAGMNAVSELQRMTESLSMYRGYIIDGEDVKIQQLSANFGAVPDLIMTGYQILAAGSDIPATRFFGQAPGGLSTDDRSGLENYYNNIAARQRLYLDPKLRKLEPYILNSTFGKGVVKPDEITREYRPLWNLSETERAAIRTADIANISALEAANLMTRPNAIEELLKREAITVKPDLDELERQADEMMSMAEAGGVDPDEAVAEVGGGFKKPSTGGITRGMGRMLSLNAGDWEESKHPRADDGKFGKGGGSAGGEKQKKTKSTDRVKSPRIKAMIEAYQGKLAEAEPKAKALAKESKQAFDDMDRAAKADGVDLDLINNNNIKAGKLNSQADFFEEHIGKIVHGRQRYDLTDVEKTKGTIANMRSEAEQLENAAKAELGKSEQVAKLRDKAWDAHDIEQDMLVQIDHMKERIQTLFYRDKHPDEFRKNIESDEDE